MKKKEEANDSLEKNELQLQRQLEPSRSGIYGKFEAAKSDYDAMVTQAQKMQQIVEKMLIPLQFPHFLLQNLV